MLNLKREKDLEKQITDEVTNDLFNIFINSENYLEFRLKIQKEGYKNPLQVWQVFHPKYDEYRLKNLEKLNKK